MDFEKYTERAQGFIQSAQALALREGHQRFSPEHLLEGSARRRRRLAAGLIKAAGGDSRLALRETEARLRRCRKYRALVPDRSISRPRRRGSSRRANQLAQKAGDSFVTAERAAAGAFDREIATRTRS